MANLTTNIKYLAKMKRYWGVFQHLTESLKIEYTQCSDASRGGGTVSNPYSRIFQYGDWFDRYPHGVSTSDFDDPAVQVKTEQGEDAVLAHKSDLHTVGEFYRTIPTPSQPDGRELSRPSKRRVKKTQSVRQEQLDPLNTNPQAVSPGQHLSMPNNNLHISQDYNQMSPTTPVNMYGQANYYANDLLMPPQQEGILPQLDRQLVFGAYAGMEPSPMNSQGGVEGWDMHMNQMPGFMNEPSSAWFMPFNMQPPEISQESDMFNGMGVTEGGYSIPNGNGMGSS